MRRLLLRVVCLCVVSGFARGEEDASPAIQVADTKPIAEVVSSAPVKNWYMGGSIGIGQLAGWSSGSSAAYYQANGYDYRVSAEAENSMGEVKVYWGKHARDDMDFEVGGSHGTNLGGAPWVRYRQTSGAGDITSTRSFNTYVLYAAASFMPITNAHWFHIKLGAHFSQLEITKTVTGTAANLNAIAAGDQIPGDGTNTGVGPLLGVGFDFRTGKVGAVRLELSRYFRIGGTSYSHDSLNLGYQINY